MTPAERMIIARTMAAEGKPAKEIATHLKVTRQAVYYMAQRGKFDLPSAMPAPRHGHGGGYQSNCDECREVNRRRTADYRAKNLDKIREYHRENQRKNRAKKKLLD